jgi:photosystem II stability/assembly factor-like uncharacterized protein
MMKKNLIFVFLLGIFVTSLLWSLKFQKSEYSNQSCSKCKCSGITATTKYPKKYFTTDSLSTEERLNLFDAIRRMPDENTLTKDGNFLTSSSQPWQQTGPWGIHYYGIEPSITYSGRVTALAYHDDVEDGGLYIGAANGGLFRFKDSFTRISENLPSLRVGAVAVDPSNPKRIFLGTGDPSAWWLEGTGLYRTTNLGVSWDTMNLSPKPSNITKIIIKGTRVFVASSRGIYRSSDLGETWARVLSLSTCDISVAGDFSYLLAGIIESGIYKSTDNGVSWFPLVEPFTTGLPLAGIGRVSVAIAPNLSSRAYVQIGKTTDSLLGIYKTTNAGESWSKLQNPPPKTYLLQQWFNNTIAVHPVNPNVVWVGGVSLYRSSDAGANWTGVGAVGSWPHAVHGDFHALLYAGSKFYAGSDGGVFSTMDEGVSWYSGMNSYLPITQFNNIDVQVEGGEWRGGGTQDNGLISTSQPDWWNWSMGRLGDGMDVAIHQGTPSKFIGTMNGGKRRIRFINGVNDDVEINDEIKSAGDDTQEWVNTYVDFGALGRFFTNAGRYVYWSTNSGDTWSRMNSSAFSYEARRIAVNSQANCVYVALDADKSLKRLDLSGSSWTVTDISNGLPTRKVRMICTDRTGETTAYAIINGGPEKIYHTTNKGDTWNNITGNIPSNLTVNDLIEYGNRIFIGTDYGAYISTNGGTNWIRWTTGMPVATQITDLEIMLKEGVWYIVAGTFGRSTFERPVTGKDPIPRLSKMRVKFGNVLIGQMKIDSIYIKNVGEAELTINNVISSITYLQVRPTTGIIAPTESLKFYTTFNPVVGAGGSGKWNGYIDFHHNAAGSPTRLEGEAYIGDGTTYRTFPPESLIVKKEVKRKTSETSWCFSFDNTSNNRDPAIELYVEFKKPVLEFDSFTPFTSAVNLDGRGVKWKFSDGAVSKGNSAIICGKTKKTNLQLVKKWWWVADIVRWDSIYESTYRGILGKVEGNKMPDTKLSCLEMPNTANFRIEMFSGYPFSKIRPLVIGVIDPDPKTRQVAYIAFAKHGDLYGSLTPGRSGKIHDGPPRKFDLFDNGKKMIGKIKKLNPDKQSNRLFAELIAFKLNLYASDIGITPPFKEEVATRGTNSSYKPMGVEPTPWRSLCYLDVGRPLHNRHLHEIDSLADVYMTYGDSSGIGSAVELYSILYKINRAFVGPVDTVSFASRLVLTGVRPIAEIPFLERDTSYHPLIRSMNQTEQTIPDEFELYQNYPNPFNPTTTIEFYLPIPAIVTLKVYDILGREVKTLLDRQAFDEGGSEIEFDASRLASGVYFYHIIAESIDEDGEQLQTYTSAKKMLLLR